jgi:hypothetical protein
LECENLLMWEIAPNQIKPILKRHHAAASF